MSQGLISLGRFDRQSNEGRVEMRSEDINDAPEETSCESLLLNVPQIASLTMRGDEFFSPSFSDLGGLAAFVMFGFSTLDADMAYRIKSFKGMF